MSQPDDIEKLLREVQALNAGTGGSVQPGPQAGAVEKPSGSSRIAWTGASAAGGLVLGGAVGTVLWFLPWISTGATAVGAAVGAAAAAFVSGPPAWFRRRA